MQLFGRDIDTDPQAPVCSAGPSPNAGTHWNTAEFVLNGPGDTVASGTQFNGLQDATGSSTSAISVTFTGDWYRAFNNLSDGPGSELQTDRVFTNTADGVGVVTIGNLDEALVYDLYLIGSLDYDTTYRVVADGLEFSDAFGASSDLFDEDSDGSFEFSEGLSHVVFRGLTPDLNGNLTIEVQGNGQNFGVLSGMQIVSRNPVPEPGSLAIFGLGSLLTLRRRRSCYNSRPSRKEN